MPVGGQESLVIQAQMVHSAGDDSGSAAPLQDVETFWAFGRLEIEWAFGSEEYL